MFEPEKLLADLPLASMTPAQLVEAIRRIAAKPYTHASPGYYLQLLGAIKILAELAEEKIDNSQFGQVK